MVFLFAVFLATRQIDIVRERGKGGEMGKSTILSPAELP